MTLQLSQFRILALNLLPLDRQSLHGMLIIVLQPLNPELFAIQLFLVDPGEVSKLFLVFLQVGAVFVPNEPRENRLHHVNLVESQIISEFFELGQICFLQDH